MTSHQFQYLHGDCLELLNEVPDHSIDMVCADLPYGTTRCRWDTPIDLEELWKQLGRVCRPDAAILMFAKTPFDKVLGMSNLTQLRYEIIWHKTSPTGHLNAKRMPMSAHENILVFYKKLPTYNPQMTSGHKRKVATRTKQSEVYGKESGQQHYDSTERYPTSVQTFAKDIQTSKWLPTQKPLELIKWLIKTYSNEGDLVLDPTMGSGTVGIACDHLNRRFIGMEKDAENFEIAVRRFRDSIS